VPSGSATRLDDHHLPAGHLRDVAAAKLQLWTTPLWLILMVPRSPTVISHPSPVRPFFAYQGEDGNGATNLGSIMLAAGVCLSLIAQIAEQIDYLRFMPPRTPRTAVAGGPP
jgi:hypothetical protein